MSKKEDMVAPEGVTVSHDEGSLIQDRCKWSMKRMITGDTPEEDAELILGTLLRPYTDRYCDSFDADDEIVMLGRQYLTKVNAGHEAPHAVSGQYGQMWEMFKAELVSHFESFYDVECTFTVTYDQMYGGPILAVEEDGSTTVYAVAFPERFGDRVSCLTSHAPLSRCEDRATKVLQRSTKMEIEDVQRSR